MKPNLIILKFSHLTAVKLIEVAQWLRSLTRSQRVNGSTSGATKDPRLERASVVKSVEAQCPPPPSGGSPPLGECGVHAPEVP
ncbi:hypothetical protein TNCV_4022811 [Trichonephila clavipes]|nr:hypothetical protein TNCV_4022811 [Trichonephila clavipes]